MFGFEYNNDYNYTFFFMFYIYSYADCRCVFIYKIYTYIFTNNYLFKFFLEKLHRKIIYIRFVKCLHFNSH